MTRLTAKEKTIAVALLSTTPISEVATMYNVSTSTIRRWRKEFSNEPETAPAPAPEAPETAFEAYLAPEASETAFEAYLAPEASETAFEAPAPAPAPEATSFNYGVALRNLTLRINFLKGSDFLSNADVKKIYNGNNPTKLLADTYQQEGNVSEKLATKVTRYFLNTENEIIVSMVQTLLNHAYSCRSKAVYKTDPDGKRIKMTDKEGKNHLIPTGIKEISYIGLCQYKKVIINGLFSIYKNNTIELDSNRVKREKANLSHDNKCEGIVAKRGKKVK